MRHEVWINAIDRDTLHPIGSVMFTSKEWRIDAEIICERLNPGVISMEMYFGPFITSRNPLYTTETKAMT